MALGRDTSGGTVAAFFEGKKKSAGGGRYKTDGKTLWVWGNVVAEKRGDRVRVCDGGYRTLLSKNTINSVLAYGGKSCTVYQEKHSWYVACATKAIGRPMKRVRWPGCIAFKPTWAGWRPLSRSRSRSR